MQKIIVAAVLLLIAQVGLTVAFFMGDNDLNAAPPDTLFLTFSPDAVQALAITDDKGATIELVKTNDAWTIPNHFAAPADKLRVDTLLGKLAGLKQGFIVATSDDAAARFKVGDTGFNDHVILKGKDGVLADFYVGTSPAFRQVHARHSNDKDIVIVGLESYELETAPEKWLDTSLVKLQGDEFTGLQFDGVKLHKEKEGWRLDGLGEGETANQGAIDSLIGQLGGLLVQDVVDPGTVAKLFEQPVFRFTATAKDGKKVDYLFVKKDDVYVLKTSDRDFCWQIAPLTVENLEKQADRKTLVTVQAEPEKQAEVSPADQKESLPPEN